MDAPDTESVQIEALPDGLDGGSTVLVASAGDPSQRAIGLRILCRRGTADDVALVVTTTESADTTVETYERVGTDGDRPALGIVDTTSDDPSVAAVYSEIPVVFTPSSDDLERLVLALSDLSERLSPSSGERHLVLRSLTPILESTPVARICTVLERITGLRSENGLCLLGIDHTAHDEETMTALTEHVDGVLWVTYPSPDEVAFECRPSRGHSRSVMSGDRDT